MDDFEASQIPLTVIGGYLGAGKTTLLNHVLAGMHAHRIAVVVNDFGSINIDAAMIESQDNEVVSLANGCICCTLATGLMQTMFMLANRSPRPEHVIIEASGVANPHKIAQYGHVPPYHLDGVVVLADAETVRMRSQDKYVGPTVIQQLKAADMILLNKVDLVTPEELDLVKQWLLDLVPGARIIPVVNAHAPVALLLDLKHRDVSPAMNAEDDHDHPIDYDTWSYRSDRPITRAGLNTALSVLPPSLLRAKGFIYINDDPERRYCFQMVGKRWNVTTDRTWGDQAPATEIVLIGLPGSIDRNQLESILSQA